MHILLALSFLGSPTQTEIGKINKGMTLHQLKQVMGEPIAYKNGVNGREQYTFKSSTKCTGYTEVCSIIIKRNKVWQFIGVKPEMLASK